VDWSHFGLERQPFRPSVDTESYFPAPSHEAALAAITAGFARREPFVLLDGSPGIGKTLVARKWLEHLLPEVPRVVVPSSCAEEPGELFQSILFDLAKPYQGLSEQELRLAVTGLLLDSAAEREYPTVLVLDEAQHLSHAALEELRLLGNLETRRGAAVFAVLVAHPMLRDALQRIAVQAALEPLSVAESEDYLRHHLRAAGGDPAEVFDDSAVSLLAHSCGGIPRVLNRVASLAIDLAGGGGSEQVDVEAALEALERAGVDAIEPEPADESAAPVLLLHPARTAESANLHRKKHPEATGGNEAPGTRGPKDKASRKRTA
jgi:type II secretory pathway predicted ATPase ExeA